MITRRSLLAASAALILPRPSRAWLIGKTGAAAYTTGAVHFDGSTYLSRASLAASNSSFFTVSYWIKLASDQSAGWTWIVDPAGNAFMSDFASTVFRPDVFVINDPFTGNRLDYGQGASDSSFNAWHHVIYSMDVNHAAGARPHTMYIDDVSVGVDNSDIGSAFTLTPNGFLATVGGDSLGNNNTMDFADFWWGVGQFLDLTMTANRRKFISAGLKPVDLGADGSTPTGTAPTFFLRRAPLGAPATFATDLSGHSNTFTINGTLTNASTSPSD